MIKRELQVKASHSSANAIAREGKLDYCMRDITTRRPVLAGNRRKVEACPNITARPEIEARSTPLPPGRTNPLDIVIFVGACEIGLGWFLIVAMISFQAGGIIALVGISTVLLGLAAKFGMATWRKFWGKQLTTNQGTN